MSFLDSSAGKVSACNGRDTEDMGSIPGLERILGEGNDNWLQYSCLGNPMERGSSGLQLNRVPNSRTWLSDLADKRIFCCLFPQSCPTYCDPMDYIAWQASLSFTISQSLLKLISTESVMPPNHLILCHPLLLLPSIFPSIKVVYNESAPCIRWPKYWRFSFSVSPSNQYSGLVSFRVDWFDLTAGQGTLKSLL